MIAVKDLAHIRSLLEASTCPFFLYDNDADGLCSFILLRRWLARGEGCAVRSHPDVDSRYAHQALAQGADLVVVLDRPFLSDGFLAALETHHIPVLWIDHHDVESTHRTHPLVHAYNPVLGKKRSNEPITHWAYKLSKRKEDAWIALMGCIADHYLPSYHTQVKKLYPDVWKNVKKPFEGYYTTELGFLARMLGFGLKDAPSHVAYLEGFLLSCASPYELLTELQSSSSFAEKSRELSKRYAVLIERALTQPASHCVFFEYGGEVSLSSELSNELSFRFPTSYIAVVYLKEGITNVSLRGKNVKSVLDKLLPQFPRASGGGHRDAVGLRLPFSELPQFRELFTTLVNT